MKTITFTKHGFAEIENEHKKLLEDRVEALEHLKKSRELGDLKENGYYQASRAKLTSIDRRIREITFLKKNALIEEPSQVSKVAVGLFVTLSDMGKEVTYQVVGAYEANPGEGKISDKSPIGSMLIGKSVGDVAVIHTPSGERNLTIKKISFTA